MTADDRITGALSSASALDHTTQYEVRVTGHLGSRWAAWFDGMSITNEGDGTTVISGPVVDQAALHGLLQKLRDIGVPLVSVTQVDQGHQGHTRGRVVIPSVPRTRTPHPKD